jgi:hypothetical protein
MVPTNSTGGENRYTPFNILVCSPPPYDNILFINGYVYGGDNSSFEICLYPTTAIRGSVDALNVSAEITRILVKN